MSWWEAQHRALEEAARALGHPFPTLRVGQRLLTPGEQPRPGLPTRVREAIPWEWRDGPGDYPYTRLRYTVEGLPTDLPLVCALVDASIPGIPGATLRAFLPHPAYVAAHLSGVWTAAEREGVPQPFPWTAIPMLRWAFEADRAVIDRARLAFRLQRSPADGPNEWLVHRASAAEFLYGAGCPRPIPARR